MAPLRVSPARLSRRSTRPRLAWTGSRSTSTSRQDQKNLGKLVDGGAAATLAFSATEGEPTAGSLKADLPFNDYTQFVQIPEELATTALKDWTGLRLHVRVKIASGLTQTGSNPAGIQPFVNSYAAGADGGAGTYNFSAKYSAAVAGNGWNDYVFDLVAGGAFDPTKIVSFGVQILTGDGVMGDAGVNPVKPTAAVVYIDSLAVEGRRHLPRRRGRHRRARRRGRHGGWRHRRHGDCAGSGGKGGSTTGGTGGTATAAWVGHRGLGWHRRRGLGWHRHRGLGRLGDRGLGRLGDRGLGWHRHRGLGWHRHRGLGRPRRQHALSQPVRLPENPRSGTPRTGVFFCRIGIRSPRPGPP